MDVGQVGPIFKLRASTFCFRLAAVQSIGTTNVIVFVSMYFMNEKLKYSFMCVGD
jgi:hypothetical protein